jgi:hypothetical protein
LGKEEEEEEEEEEAIQYFEKNNAYAVKPNYEYWWIRNLIPLAQIYQSPEDFKKEKELALK